MSDSPTISRLARRTAGDGYLREEEQECADFGCFGWLRGTRERALMLELRKSNGDILAIGYAWMEKMTFNPSEGILLHVGSQQISLIGRNLNAGVGGVSRLFDGLTRHRIAWIREMERGEAIQAAASICVVESILWT